MLRDNYKKAFSQINPSEETIERIFEMSEKKHSKKIRKGLIIAIALIAVLLFGVLTAYAATDGAIFDPPISFSCNSSGGIRLMSGGIYLTDKTSYVNDDGQTVDQYDFDYDGDGELDERVFAISRPDGSGLIITAPAQTAYEDVCFDN